MFKMKKKIFVETFRSTTGTTPLNEYTSYSGRASLAFLGESADNDYGMSSLDSSNKITPCYRSETNSKQESPNGDVETKTSITERWSLDLYPNGSDEVFVNLRELIDILSHCGMENCFALSVCEELINWEGDDEDNYDEYGEYDE